MSIEGSRMLLDTLTGMRPLTRHAKAATPLHVEQIRAKVNNCHDLFLSVVESHLKNLNENLQCIPISFGAFADVIIDNKRALNDEFNRVLAQVEKIAAGDL